MAGRKKKSDAGSNGSDPQFNKGDWIVHISHGIGKVVRIEKKLVRGEKIPCYRVKTEDSVFWIPVGADVSDRVRPIATPRKFKRVVRLLAEPGEQMAKMHKNRRKRIRDHTLDGKLKTTAALIRDLWARKHRKSLNDTEMRALQKLTDRFVKEWSISMDIPPEEAHKRLNEIVMTTLQEES
jgi:RNA polymerase-interacting CarD/CdnL/TRCF family regulator